MSGERVVLLGAGMPDPMGASPEKLKTVQASRQNTLVLRDGEPVVVRASNTGGGLVWSLLNIGPGIVFARWDGQGYAAPNDPHSIQLVSGAGYLGISTETLTLACLGETQVSFGTVTTPQGGFFHVGGAAPPVPEPPPPPAPQPAPRQPERQPERHERAETESSRSRK